MKISDQINLSARNLSRRKGRTALTLVGVVIGTCMVVLMISLGIAQTASNDEMLQSWGDLTSIELYGGGSSGQMGPDGKPLHLNDKMLDTFRKMDHVVAGTPFASIYGIQGQVAVGTNGRYQLDLNNSNLIGIDPTAMEVMGFSLADGAWLEPGTAPEKGGKLPVLVCQQTAYEFQDTRKSESSPKRMRYYGDTDAMGNEVQPFFDINKDKMTLTVTDGDKDSPKSVSWDLVVVGSLSPDGSKGWWTQNGIVLRLDDALMLQRVYKALSKTSDGNSSTDSKDYEEVHIKVDDLKYVDDVQDAIMELGFSKDYISSMAQQRESMQQQVFRQQMIFGGIAAVSLLVAAINIINTMTMAIYERTREIGIMKVLGCEVASIRSMFLLESSCIGFLGGLVGVVFSLIASFVLNRLAGMAGGGMDFSGMGGGYGMGGGTSVISIIPPWLLLAALAFATLIGFVAGILPANKAVKISALEAIRHD